MSLFPEEWPVCQGLVRLFEGSEGTGEKPDEAEKVV
jgi:hypothetical protein